MSGLGGTYPKHHPRLGSSYQTALAPHLAHGVVVFVMSLWIEAMQCHAPPSLDVWLVHGGTVLYRLANRYL